MNRYDIQQFIREHNLNGFVEEMEVVLSVEGAVLPNGSHVRMRPEEFSLLEIWEAVKPAGYHGPIVALRESGALDATGFPTITEKLLSSAFIDGYSPRMAIADQLVPNSVEPKTLTERIPGITMMEGPKIILPGSTYPTIGFSDKYVNFEQAIFNKKEGYAIEVTEEAVRFDQTNMIVSAAREAGMTLQTERERRTIRAVLGIGDDSGTTIAGVYFPSGVDTALYRASENNLRTDTTPIFVHPGNTSNSKLIDYTDLQEVMTVHAQNIKDDRLLGTSRPIAWTPDRVLVPVSLASTAANIFQAMGVTTIASFTAGTDREVRTQIGGNALQTLFSGAVPQPYASAYVDEVSATTWVVYDSRRAFVRVNIFPFATFRSAPGYGEMRDVLFAVRVREWSRVIAKDFRHCVRNTGAT